MARQAKRTSEAAREVAGGAVRGDGTSISAAGSSSMRLSSLQTEVPLPRPGISSSWPSRSTDAFVRLVRNELPCRTTCNGHTEQ